MRSVCTTLQAGVKIKPKPLGLISGPKMSTLVEAAHQVAPQKKYGCIGWRAAACSGAVQWAGVASRLQGLPARQRAIKITGHLAQFERPRPPLALEA